MDVHESDQIVPDTDVKEPTSVEVAEEEAKNCHVKSRKQITNEEKGCCSQRLIWWLFLIIGSIVLIITVGVLLCMVFGRSDNRSDALNPIVPDGGNDCPDCLLPIRATTHGYRFTETDFDDCCGNDLKKSAYLKACNHEFKEDNIECVNVIPGSAIVITQSENPDHKKILLEKFSKMKTLNGHSTDNGHHMSEDAVKAHKAENKIQELQREIDEKNAKINALSKEHTNQITESALQKVMTNEKILDLENTHKMQIKQITDKILEFAINHNNLQHENKIMMNQRKRNTNRIIKRDMKIEKLEQELANQTKDKEGSNTLFGNLFQQEDASFGNLFQEKDASSLSKEHTNQITVLGKQNSCHNGIFKEKIKETDDIVQNDNIENNEYKIKNDENTNKKINAQDNNMLPTKNKKYYRKETMDTINTQNNDILGPGPTKNKKYYRKDDATDNNE